MRIIAVDDEVLQLETIMEYVSEFYPAAEVSGFSKVSQAIDFAERQPVDVAILDISMPGSINGISLGQMLRRKNPNLKLLYCTGYSEYAIDAFKMHANGYLTKPIRKDVLRQELQYVLRMPVFNASEKPYIQTFGNFDLFVRGKPVLIQRSKSKEILAWLTNRKGGWVSNKELASILWESAAVDSAMVKYTSTLVKNLITDLESAGCGHILERQWGKLRLLTDEVICDYYSYLAGDETAKSSFQGEYMTQYSWGEAVLGLLIRNTQEK